MEIHYLGATKGAKLLAHNFVEQAAKYAVKEDGTTKPLFQSRKLRLEVIKQFAQDLKKGWKAKNKP